MQAIPAEALIHLYQIEGQYWSCHKHYDEGLPYWLCACSKGDGMIHYGDMVKLYANADDSFYWNANSGSGSMEDRPPTEYFTFVEQPDYTSIFVELDSTENPLEIGVFIDDSCVGATTVFREDTLVLILAYTEGMSGDLSFQEYFSNKSVGIEKTEYYVLDEPSGTWIKTVITTEKLEKSYLVSFKGKQV